MQIQIEWAGEVAFLGQSSGGHTIVMDGPAETGGRNLGPRPMEMLLLGLGSCSSYDVISILKKSRQSVLGCKVSVSADRARQEPKVFTKIHIHYTVTGQGLEEKKIARAVSLSINKYCSAAIMLGASAKITHSFEVVESA